MRVAVCGVEKLSQREVQCLYWAAQDKTLDETAQQLNLSPETIKTYRKVLLRKLNCQTMTGALTRALKEGIL